MHFRRRFTMLLESEGQTEAKFTFLQQEIKPLTQAFLIRESILRSSKVTSVHNISLAFHPAKELLL